MWTRNHAICLGRNMWWSSSNSDLDRPSGSRPEGEREYEGPVELGQGNLPRKDELVAFVGWRMVYSIMQVLAAEGSTIVQAIYDGHSHLDCWSVEVGKREAREHLAAMPYETVTSYCFSKRWLD